MVLLPPCNKSPAVYTVQVPGDSSPRFGHVVGAKVANIAIVMMAVIYEVRMRNFEKKMPCVGFNPNLSPYDISFPRRRPKK